MSSCKVWNVYSQLAFIGHLLFQLQEYYVLSLPHTATEPSLASLMSRLPPLPGSTYPEVLLLGHRAGLNVQEGSWEVRLAVPDDVVGLHGLIGSLANAVEVQEAFLHALGRLSCWQVTCSVPQPVVECLRSQMPLRHLKPQTLHPLTSCCQQLVHERSGQLTTGASPAL